MKAATMTRLLEEELSHIPRAEKGPSGSTQMMTTGTENGKEPAR